MDIILRWSSLLQENNVDKLVTDFESLVLGIRFHKEHRTALIALIKNIVDGVLDTNATLAQIQQLSEQNQQLTLKVEDANNNAEQRRQTAIKYYKLMQSAQKRAKELESQTPMPKLELDEETITLREHEDRTAELRKSVYNMHQRMDRDQANADHLLRRLQNSERVNQELTKQIEHLQAKIDNFTYQTPSGTTYYDPIEEDTPPQHYSDSVESPSSDGHFSYYQQQNYHSREFHNPSHYYNHPTHNNSHHEPPRSVVKSLRNIAVNKSLLPNAQPANFSKPKKSVKFNTSPVTQYHRTPPQYLIEPTHTTQTVKPKRTKHNVTIHELVDAGYLHEGDAVQAYTGPATRDGLIVKQNGTYGILDSVNEKFYPRPSTWVVDEEVLNACDKIKQNDKKPQYSGWTNVRVKRRTRNGDGEVLTMLADIRDQYKNNK